MRRRGTGGQERGRPAAADTAAHGLGPLPEPGLLFRLVPRRVYDVEAATEDGTRLTVTIILFGRKASGRGWIKIDAKGTSGEHYDSVDESEVPHAAHDAIGAA